MTTDLILGVAIGTVFGLLISLLFNKVSGGGGSSKVKELEAEHETYRKKVDDHFVNSAVLLKGLTDQYRDVYKHIATGAGDLCSDEAKAIQLDMEETALLAQSAEVAEVQEEESIVAVESPAEAVAEEGSEQPSSTVDEPKPTPEPVEYTSEVEVPAEVVEELKKQAASKSKE